jgi:hypothetical protein
MAMFAEHGGGHVLRICSHNCENVGVVVGRGFF